MNNKGCQQPLRSHHSFIFEYKSVQLLADVLYSLNNHNSVSLINLCVFY